MEIVPSIPGHGHEMPMHQRTPVIWPTQQQINDTTTHCFVEGELVNQEEPVAGQTETGNTRFCHSPWW